MLTGMVRTVGLREVQAKALAANARVLATNYALVSSMLLNIKPIVEADTPLGPGHFGYHLRYSYKTDIKAEGVRTIGVLKSPPQGYWREFGTMAGFRKGGAASAAMARAAYRAVFSTGGEPARMTAHKAANATRRFITAYYGGLANWWRA